MRLAHPAPPARRGLLSLIQAYAVVLALCFVPAGPTHASVDERAASTRTAPTDEALLRVRLDAVTPSIAGPGTDVVVSGTLSNVGTDPARVHSVRVSTALRGLDTREAVSQWSTQGSLDTPVLLAEDRISAALEPGAVVRFFARVPAGAADPGFDFATLPLRIEVTEPVLGSVGAEGSAAGDGDEAAGDGDEAAGDDAEVVGEVLPGTELRTYLPWQAVGADQFNPIDIAWVAPLTLPGGAALVDPDDTVRAQAWSAAIGPDSANVAMLAGLSDTAATFIVDPAVFTPLDPVASLTEAVQLPGEETEEPTEPEDTPTDPTSEPSEDSATVSPPAGQATGDPPESTGSEPTPAAPGTGSTDSTSTDPALSDSASTDPESTDPASTDPESTDSEGDALESGGEGAGEGTAGDPAGEQDPAQPTGAVTSGPDDAAATSTGGADPSGGEPTGDPEPVEPPTPPTTEAAVLALSALIAQVPEQRLWWLPVADPDTGALLDLGAETEDVAALVGRPPVEPLVAAGRTDIAWPVSTELDDAMVASLTDVWRMAGGATGAAGLRNGSLAAVLLPSSGIEGETFTGSAARSYASGTRLLGYDERLSGVVAAAGTPDQDGRSVQRFLAETMAVYQQRPAEDRSLVVAIPRGTHVDADTLRELTGAAHGAPWLAETSAGELLDTRDAGDQAVPAVVVPPPPPPTGEGDGTGTNSTRADAGVPAPGNLTAYTTPGPSPLTTGRVAQVEEARASLAGASEIVPGSEEADATWRRVLDGQYSTRWRQDTAGWSASVDRVVALAREILTGLTINPTTINFFADEGLIRITVTNDLPVQIDNLQMTVSPGNARLRILGQPDPITIGPESRATVQFRARAIAAGEVPLSTTLSTPNGTPVGQEAETSVRVRPAGVWIYWLLGGVAGVILVLGLVRALRPRSPSSQSEQKVEAPGPDTESP